MSQKINCDNLYVACQVYDHEIETEMYEQYCSFGNIEHNIIVNPHKRLFYKSYDDNDKEIFYDFKTNKQVVEQSYDSSFNTNSSPFHSLYCGYINGEISMPIMEFRKEFLNRYNSKKNVYGYFIPFNEYVKEKLGITLNFITPFMAELILHLINIGAGKSFILSMNPEEAALQLEKIGYRKQNEKKRIIK